MVKPDNVKSYTYDNFVMSTMSDLVGPGSFMMEMDDEVIYEIPGEFSRKLQENTKKLDSEIYNGFNDLFDDDDF